MVKETIKHQVYDWRNQVGRPARRDEKTETAVPAQQAPGYAEYEASLAFSTQNKVKPAGGTPVLENGVQPLSPKEPPLPEASLLEPSLEDEPLALTGTNA